MPEGSEAGRPPAPGYLNRGGCAEEPRAEPRRRKRRCWASRQSWPAPLTAAALEGPAPTLPAHACPGCPPFWTVAKPPSQSPSIQGEGLGKDEKQMGHSRCLQRMLLTVHTFNKNILNTAGQVVTAMTPGRERPGFRS